MGRDEEQQQKKKWGETGRKEKSIFQKCLHCFPIRKSEKLLQLILWIAAFNLLSVSLSRSHPFSPIFAFCSLPLEFWRFESIEIQIFKYRSELHCCIVALHR